jgi:hypothetical protein
MELWERVKEEKDFGCVLSSRGLEDLGYWVELSGREEGWNIGRERSVKEEKMENELGSQGNG